MECLEHREPADRPRHIWQVAPLSLSECNLLTWFSLTAEYKNSGAGSEGTRASFASTLIEPVLITEVLGSDYESMEYVDTAYLG